MYLHVLIAWFFDEVYCRTFSCTCWISVSGGTCTHALTCTCTCTSTCMYRDEEHSLSVTGNQTFWALHSTPPLQQTMSVRTMQKVCTRACTSFASHQPCVWLIDILSMTNNVYTCTCTWTITCIVHHNQRKKRTEKKEESHSLKRTKIHSNLNGLEKYS